MSWTYVQNAKSNGTGTSLSATLNALSYAAGDLLVVGVVGVAGAMIPTFTVADGDSNAFTACASAVGNGLMQVQLFFGPSVAAALSGNVITVTATHSATMQMIVAQYQPTSGTGQLLPNVLDGTSSNSGTGINPTAGNVLVSANGELLVGVLGVVASSVAITPSAGYADRAQDTSISPEIDLMDKAAVSTANPGWTLAASHDWAAMGASFLVGAQNPYTRPVLASQELIPPEWQE